MKFKSAALAAALVLTPPAAMGQAYYIYQNFNPAVWWSGGSFYYAGYDAGGDYCCGRIFTTNQIYGNLGPVWWGATNALGDPLQFGTRYTNWARSVGLEFVNTDSGGTPAHITKFFLSDGTANFNAFSCWSSGCPGNNMVVEFCCVPNDGVPHAEIITYNTYAPEQSTLTVDGSWSVGPFVVYKGGQGQPFIPDFYGGGSFYQGILSPEEAQYGPSPSIGGFNGGSDFLYWTQWDTGIAPQSYLIQSGNTYTYPFNSESGAQWAPGALGGYMQPEDYTMGPD